MTIEVGTLKELNLKEGDEVEMVTNDNPNYVGELCTIDSMGNAIGPSGVFAPIFDSTYNRTYKVVSRVTDTPKPWKYLTPEEKGALLLAHHEGSTLEVYNSVFGWEEVITPSFDNSSIYRVKPAIETHTHVVFAHGERRNTRFNTVNYKVDWDSFEVLHD